MNWDADIVIAGGGLAGLTAAVAFGGEGWSVVLAAPALDRMDNRTTAIFQPGQRFLAELGVWPILREEPMPLQQMRIVDASDGFVERTFDAADVSELPFGWNVRNEAIRGALEDRLAVLSVEQVAEPVEGLVSRSGGVVVRLGGKSLRAGMVVGCDGRHSVVRQSAGIEVREQVSSQQALVFQVYHPIAHENVSTEVHCSGGPFTLVPLPSDKGRHRSAVVWMEEGAELARLMEMTPVDFNNSATQRSCGVLGPLELVSDRQAWPLRSALAKRLSLGRVALAGEAAHVVPPIGAQGFNMTLDDIATLLEVSRRHAPGAQAAMDAYHRRRWPDLAMRISGVAALAGMSRTGVAPLQTLRRAGLAGLHDVPVVRRAIMRLGMGA